MCSDSVGNDVPQTLVVIRSGREGIVSCVAEGESVPRQLTSETKLYLDEGFEAGDIILIGDFVHLGVDEKLLLFFAGFCARFAGAASEGIAVAIAVSSAGVVGADRGLA